MKKNVKNAHDLIVRSAMVVLGLVALGAFFFKAQEFRLLVTSSRTAMNIFNKALFIASVLCFWIYARCDVAWLLPVAATLCVAVLVLFVLLLCVNLYYEKRG